MGWENILATIEEDDRPNEKKVLFYFLIFTTMSGWNMTGEKLPNEEKANKAINDVQFKSSPFNGVVVGLDTGKKGDWRLPTKDEYQKLIDKGLVGATSPEHTGLYFAWGETEGYTAEQVTAKEKLADTVQAEYDRIIDNQKDGQEKTEGLKR